MFRFVVYKYNSDLHVEHAPNAEFTFVFWKPSLRNFIPPGLPPKYILWWFAHVGGLFNNKGYCSILVYKGTELVHSLCVIPSYYRWPFMGKNDLQFTNVVTHEGYRGKGIAREAILFAISKLQKPGRAFWYVTDTENPASMNLAKKAGFEFVNYAKRTYAFNLRFLKKLELTEN